MTYKRISSVLFFSMMLLSMLCQHASGQESSMRVARIFSDNMVLQQGIYAPVWGWAPPGVQVRIGIGGKEYTTVADKTGKWLVRMEPMQVGGPYTLSVSCDGHKRNTAM